MKREKHGKATSANPTSRCLIFLMQPCIVNIKCKLWREPLVQSLAPHSRKTSGAYGGEQISLRIQRAPSAKWFRFDHFFDLGISERKPFTPAKSGKSNNEIRDHPLASASFKRQYSASHNCQWKNECRCSTRKQTVLFVNLATGTSQVSSKTIFWRPMKRKPNPFRLPGISDHVWSAHRHHWSLIQGWPHSFSLRVEFLMPTL